MKKNIFMFLLAGIFVLGLSGFSFAMMCGSDSGHSEHLQLAKARPGAETQEAIPETNPSSEEAVNVGNKICPVSGEEIDEKLKATYEYKGKVYNFCCATCINNFKKDPEKYIKNIEDELKAEAEKQAQDKEHEMGMMQESKMPHQGMHEGHQH